MKQYTQTVILIITILTSSLFSSNYQISDLEIYEIHKEENTLTLEIIDYALDQITTEHQAYLTALQNLILTTTNQTSVADQEEYTRLCNTEYYLQRKEQELYSARRNYIATHTNQDPELHDIFNTPNITSPQTTPNLYTSPLPPLSPLILPYLLDIDPLPPEINPNDCAFP